MNIPRIIRLMEMAVGSSTEFLTRNGTLMAFSHRGPEEVQRAISTMPDGPAKQALSAAMNQYAGSQGVHDFGNMSDPLKDPKFIALCAAADRELARGNHLAAA